MIEKLKRYGEPSFVAKVALCAGLMLALAVVVLAWPTGDEKRFFLATCKAEGRSAAECVVLWRGLQ